MLIRVKIKSENALKNAKLFFNEDICNIKKISLSFSEVSIIYFEFFEKSCELGLFLDINYIKLANYLQKLNNFNLPEYLSDNYQDNLAILSIILYELFANNNIEDKFLEEASLEFNIFFNKNLSEGGSIKNLLEPLGFEVGFKDYPLNLKSIDWAVSKYENLNLKCQDNIKNAILNLIILLPIIANKENIIIYPFSIDNILNKKDIISHPIYEKICTYYKNQEELLCVVA